MKTLTKIGRYQTPTAEFRFNLSLVSYNIRELHDIRAEAQKEGMKAWCQVPRRQIHDPKDCTSYSNCPENDCFSLWSRNRLHDNADVTGKLVAEINEGCIVHPVFSCGTSCLFSVTVDGYSDIERSATSLSDTEARGNKPFS